jgi:hypothetical protein
MIYQYTKYYLWPLWYNIYILKQVPQEAASIFVFWPLIYYESILSFGTAYCCIFIATICLYEIPPGDSRGDNFSRSNVIPNRRGQGDLLYLPIKILSGVVVAQSI